MVIVVSGRTKRSRIKYPGLDKSVHPKVRQDLIDHDYIDKLSPSEKKWLSDFNEEYLGGNFKHGGRVKHKTKKEKRDCYNRNNARNRDAMSITKINSMLEYGVKKTSLNNLALTEENLVNIIDHLRKK